jgi:type II secretory pathway component HofQ
VRVRLIALCLLTAGALLAAEPSAAQLFAKGRKAENAGHMAEAYILYSEAAAKEPGNRDYWMRCQAVRSRAELEELLAAPIGPPGPATAAAPLPEFPPPTPEDLAAARQPLPPTQLKAQSGLKDFDLNGNAQQLFEAVARAFGLECIFDNDYQAGAPMRFHLTGVDYRDALHGLEAVTGSFIVALSDLRFMVVKDTAAKRTEREPVAAVIVHLPEAVTPQEFTEIIRDVQQAMAVEHVAQDTQNNTVILRDRISKVLPARDMFENFMRPRAQVMIEVRFLEISRNSDITYGLTLPTQFPLLALTNWFNNQPSIPQAINGLLSFGGGKTLLGLGVMDAASVATMSVGTGNVLLESAIRSVDGQPASLHVGDRYPIVTSGYSGGTAATTASGSSYSLPPAFTFEDLGLTMKVTPSVHNVEDVSLDIDAAFKVLSGTSVNGLPVISNRQIKSQAQLKFGEWAMIAGLLNTQEARTIAGVAGLARIPFLGPLTSTHDHSKNDNQVVILIEPRLLTPPPNATRSWTFHLGSDTKPITPL